MTLLQERKRYAAAALGTALFAAIYECFSHQVYSGFMIFAFLFPLLGGVFPCSVLLKAAKQKRPGLPSRCLYASGIAALTMGSLFQGILTIYGTTSHLSKYYWLSGGLLVLIALSVYLIERAFSAGARRKNAARHVQMSL